MSQYTGILEKQLDFAEFVERLRSIFRKPDGTTMLGRYRVRDGAATFEREPMRAHDLIEYAVNQTVATIKEETLIQALFGNA